jgi:hypothetical protein
MKGACGQERFAFADLKFVSANHRNQHVSRVRFPENKMPDVDSYDSSSGIAVDVQQRLNCALPSFVL